MVKRDIENLGMSIKEMIQVISDLSHEKLFIQAENHLDHLIQEKRIAHLKRIGQVVTAQTTTTEQ